MLADAELPGFGHLEQGKKERNLMGEIRLLNE